MKLLRIALILLTLQVMGQSPELAVQKADSMTRRFANQIFNRAAVVGVYYHGQDTIIPKGHINSWGRKADADDIFQIGSVTKSITGFMLAKEVLNGTISLDDSISPYIHIKKKSKFDSVTIRHLATHTSGLPNNTLDVFGPTFLAGAGVGLIRSRLIFGPLGAPAIIVYSPWQSIFVPPLPHYSTYGKGALNEDLRLARLKKYGTYKYSNIGFGIIGNILSETHGLNYEGLLQQEFCEPLGLKETSTKPKKLPKGKYATPHDFFGIRTVRTQFADGGMEGAGDVKMSANDLMKYLKLQFDTAHVLAPVIKLQQQSHFKAFDKKHHEIEIGLGWLKKIDKQGREVFWHHDHLLGTSSFIGFIPSENIGIFLLANNAKDKKLTKIGLWWLRQQ